MEFVNMEHNLMFTLGDPSADGHGHTAEYHLTSNYSASEISEAYRKTTELLSFDLVEDIGNEFEGDYWVPSEYAEELVKLGIIEEDDLEEGGRTYGPPAGSYYLDTDSFGDLYFKIAQYSLPDLVWEDHDLQEEEICDLYGAAYGLAYKG